VSVAEDNPDGKIPETPERQVTSPFNLPAAILITAAIAGLHLFFLFHAGGFWRDEVNLINLASSHSLADMKKDSFPVLMPLLVHGWSELGFGKTDLSLRVFGTLIGLGIPAAFWLAAWKTRRAPPLLSISLFCMNSTLLVFGDSLRAYGLGSLFIVLTAAAAVPFLRQPSWRRTGWLALQFWSARFVAVRGRFAGGRKTCWRQ